MAERVDFRPPAGRIVQGSLYKAYDKDMDGKPLLVKSGPRAGQPTVRYFFALAIPKGAERHWAETAWGQIIWNTGHAAFRDQAKSPAFAWKVEDGDSTVTNSNGRRPCDQEGFPGNWIVRFSGGFGPKVYRQDGQSFVQVIEEDFVKPGYYVEVFATVLGNNSAIKPGVFINPTYVCFRGYGSEIHFGPDVNEVGFGAAPLPAGASLTPPASSIPMPGTAPAGPVAVPAASYAPAVPATPVPMTAGVVPVAQSAIAPNMGFLQGTMIPATHVPSAVPSPSNPQLVLTAKAAGNSYQTFINAGWTPERMVAEGYLVYQ